MLAPLRDPSTEWRLLGDHARRTGSGMEMRVLTWGAVIRDLVVPTLQPARSRSSSDSTSIEDYAPHSPYFGAIVGRYANRIGRARFTLEGVTYLLDANEGRNQLHGGPHGFGTRLWTHPRSRALQRHPGAWSRRMATWAIRAGLSPPAPIASRSPPPCAIELEAIADKRDARQSHQPRLFQSRWQPGHLLAPPDDRGRLHHADATPTSSPPARSRASPKPPYDFTRPAADRARRNCCSRRTLRHQLRAPRRREHLSPRSHPVVPARTASPWSCGPRSQACNSTTDT